MSTLRPLSARVSFLCLLLLSINFAVVGAEDPAASLHPWNEYRTIMWIGDTAYRSPEKLPLFFQRLREVGINTAMVFGDADPKPLLDNHLPYYVENMVNRGLCLKFSSKVQDWDKFVTNWARNGRPESAMIRDYCLDDPAWLSPSIDTVRRITTRNQLNHPVAYNLRDELSTTISANPFDYDFNPIALEAFREWLRSQYGSLAALNQEWQTQFGSWDEVRPFTTDQIKTRMASGEAVPRGQPDWQQLKALQFDYAQALKNPTAWNFSPWADFRTYMDLSLARALDKLRDAAHAVDPLTPVGIEGTQMPNAFGGYDLWRLSQVLDWVEPYDIACSREIFGSFMPGRPILTTVFESHRNPAARRLWHLLLEGDRGCLVWWSEDCIDWKSSDWQLTPKARNLTPVLQEMTSPLARLFLRARREHDPIYIHYSQPSIQVDWLMESTVDGSTWVRRFSSFEAEHNQMGRTRTAWLKGLQDLGYSPQFVSSEQLESGKLAGTRNPVMVLANSWALSERELGAVEKTFNGGGPANSSRLLVEGPAGIFDEHGKLRAQAQASSLLATNGCLCMADHQVVSANAAPSRAYLKDRLSQKGETSWLSWLKQQTEVVPVEVQISPNARARVHRFSVPSGRLIGIERNIDYQMSEELKQAGGNEALEHPVEVEAHLRAPTHVYDLRSGKYFGFTDHVSFVLDPWHPALFALLQDKVPATDIVERLLREL